MLENPSQKDKLSLPLFLDDFYRNFAA